MRAGAGGACARALCRRVHRGGDPPARAGARRAPAGRVATRATDRGRARPTSSPATSWRPTTTRGSCWSRRRIRSRAAVPPEAQPRLAVQVHQHPGRQRDLHRPPRASSGRSCRRNDIQLTRDVFYFSGFAFDPRLDFNILIYTSSATLSATAAGYVGYAFHEAFTLRAGFFSLPSLRAMTGTYPFFHGTDRSMAVNYMRPGFTQGVWAEGEPLPGFSYIAMIGQLAQHPGHHRHEDRLQLRLLRLGLVRPQRVRLAVERLRVPRRGGPAGGDRLHLRARGSPVGSVDGQPREQRHLHLGRHPAVRDRLAGAGRHRPARELLPVGGRRRASSTAASRSTSSSTSAG